MVEVLQECKVDLYINTNKGTHRAELNLKDYKSLDDMLTDANKWLRDHIPY